MINCSLAITCTNIKLKAVSAKVTLNDITRWVQKWRNTCITLLIALGCSTITREGNVLHNVLHGISYSNYITTTTHVSPRRRYRIFARYSQRHPAIDEADWSNYADKTQIVIVKSDKASTIFLSVSFRATWNSFRGQFSPRSLRKSKRGICMLPPA